MMGVSRGAVWTAALVLVGSAAVGSYLGYSRALAAVGGSADSDTYVAPLAAKKATSVDNPAPPPPVDENYIRKIAHDEAVAVVHPPPKKVRTVEASDDSDDDDDDSDAKTPGANPPTPPAIPAPAPVAIPKAPPPPTGLY